MTDQYMSSAQIPMPEWRVKELVRSNQAFLCAGCMHVFSRIDHKDILMRSTATGADVTLCKDCAHRMLADGVVMKVPNLLYDVDCF